MYTYIYIYIYIHTYLRTHNSGADQGRDGYIRPAHGWSRWFHDYIIQLILMLVPRLHR